ncbi:ABC transporter substrate-binding protein [Nguyenibacter vanlangensis]|uniref:ABC transporter substrate-binding protein n=2 Tax=Nguyenibacter vanlangensis TaxID=1216886 RepID=A0A7Y7M7I5_9PROT|nr:ABC transporter substrate-binding protein [Nguyenibacter vanlangensis]
MMVMRRLTFSLPVALGVGLAVLPVAAPVFGPAAASAQTGAQTGAQAGTQAPAAAAGPVSALYAALQQIQAATGSSFAQRAQILAPVVDKVYDLETVLRASVGLRYGGLSGDDRQKLLAVFRQFTVARYVSSFKPGGDARFNVNPAPRPSPVGSDQIVTTHIGSTDDPDGTEIDYVMRPGPQGWHIVDVLLNAHISQVAAQRSDFSSTLASGNVQNLISLLEKKVKAFSEG